MTHDPLNSRHTDSGPIYVETVDFAAAVVEPFNAASAFLFVVIVAVWVVRLWGRYREYPLLTCCLPILLVGGVGGTLYHATRSSRAFFLMDVVPIGVLGLVVSATLWVRLAPRWTNILAFVGVIAAMQAVGQLTMSAHWAINIEYLGTALVILVPTFLAMVRTRFRYSQWVWAALALFALAFAFRTIDVLRPPVLPMGTHWLWHTFGAMTTQCLSEYLYRIEGLSLRRPE